MSQKEDFYYTSASGNTKIHAVRYIPDQKIKAILQISHGMVEHIERYEDFARYLNSKGILVTGNDHLGHGSSVNSPDDFGYFAKKDGNKAVLYDVYQLTQITKESYPNLPYFLLGHSMGSFIARQYLCQFGGELDGVILMGTGYPSPLLVQFGRCLTGILSLFLGSDFRSPLVNYLAFGSYNKHFQPVKTSKDWLTKDPKQVQKYLSDPRCQFIFTVNGLYHMFTGISHLYHQKFLKKMPSHLPVLFVSGKEDPVGDLGKGVIKSARSFQKAGMKNIKVKLYPDDRHEILNETDREVVYRHLYRWIASVLA